MADRADQGKATALHPDDVIARLEREAAFQITCADGLLACVKSELRGAGMKVPDTAADKANVNPVRPDGVAAEESPATIVAAETLLEPEYKPTGGLWYGAEKSIARAIMNRPKDWGYYTSQPDTRWSRRWDKFMTWLIDDRPKRQARKEGPIRAIGEWTAFFIVLPAHVAAEAMRAKNGGKGRPRGADPAWLKARERERTHLEESAEAYLRNSGEEVAVLCGMPDDLRKEHIRGIAARELFFEERKWSERIMIRACALYMERKKRPLEITEDSLLLKPQNVGMDQIHFNQGLEMTARERRRARKIGKTASADLGQRPRMVISQYKNP